LIYFCQVKSEKNTYFSVLDYIAPNYFNGISSWIAFQQTQIDQPVSAAAGLGEAYQKAIHEMAKPTYACFLTISVIN
jgi:3-methyladenine DNA glycosylase/8-oxoguanine DNA glycosylase